MSNGTGSLLTLVFASLFLILIGFLTHNAFADTVTGTIPTIGTSGAWGVATNPNTDMTYVASGYNDTKYSTSQSYQIQVINDTTNTVVASVKPTSVPSGSYGCFTYTVAVNPMTNLVYTNNNACTYWPPSSAPFWIPQTVSVINGTNNQVIKVVTLTNPSQSSESPQPIAVNPSTNKVYALTNLGPAFSSSNIAVINGTSYQVITNISVPDNEPSDIAINPQTNTIYVLGGSVIYVIDGKTDSVVTSFSWGKASNEGIGVNTATNKIYVSNSDNSVSVIDGSTHQVITAVQAAAYGFVSVNSATNKIYIGSLSSNTVTVINGETNAASLVPVGSGPYGIGINADTNKIYVGNSGSGTVSVIDGSTASTPTVPSPPQNLQSDDNGYTPASLSWTAPSINGGSPITNYNIYRATTSGHETLLATAGNVTSYTDNTVNNVQAFFYRVTAVNSVGESPQSNEAAWGGSGTDSITLNNVKSTSGTTSTSNQITLSNFNPESGSNNLLVVGVGANNAAVSSVTFGGASLTKAVSSFSNNDAEFWYMTNPSGIGNIVVTMSGPTSAVVGAYSLSGVDQTSPIPTTATNHSTSASSPVISITTKYTDDTVLELSSIWGGSRLGSPTCTQQWDVSVSNAITSASSATVVLSPTTVTCKWTASSADLWDDVAVELRSASTTTTSPTVPGAPTGLAATGGNAQITLSWAASSNDGGSAVTGYNVYRGTTPGGEGPTPIASGITSTTYIDTGLTNVQAYYYIVRAVNSVGTSGPSNEASATPASSSSGTTSSITLNNVQSTSGTTSSSNQITLSSFNAGTASNQLLLVGVSANNNNVALVTFNGTPLTRTVSSFVNNDAEFWYLTNPSGTGDIAVTMNGATHAVVGAYSFSGVNQSNPIPTHRTNHNTSAGNPSISVTTQYPNDWVVDLPSIYGGSTLGSPTCTQQWDLNVPNAITGASSSTLVQSPATVTCKWSASSADFWDDIAVELRAAG